MLSKLWQDFLLIKPEEAFLVRTNLMYVDMIVPGFGKPLDLLDMLGRIRPTYDHIGNLVFTYQLRRLGKMRWRRQFLRQFTTFETSIRPVRIRRVAGASLILGPADGELPIGRLAAPTRAPNIT